MKPKRTISAYVLLVGIMGLSVIGGALIFGVYSSLVKTQITTEQSELIKPLDGKIDPEVLDVLQTKRVFTSSELAAEIIPNPTPTLIENSSNTISSQSAVTNF